MFGCSQPHRHRSSFFSATREGNAQEHTCADCANPKRHTGANTHWTNQKVGPTMANTYDLNVNEPSVARCN